MAYSGLDFYNRLSDICQKNGTSITAFLVSIGKSQSAGTYMKSKKTPDAVVVKKASERFNISTEWLLGLSDVEIENSKNHYELDDDEAALIDNLRSTDAITRKNVYKMASAVLSSPPIRAEEPQQAHFSSPKSDTVHINKTPKRAMKRVEGSAAAGLPIEAVPDGETRITVPVKYLDDRYFIVRARGDSMTGAGIDDGDFCVFDTDAYQDDGAVMIAFIDGFTDRSDGAIKRVYRIPGSDPDGDDARVELRSANPKYAPMVYPAGEVRVTGVLVDILKSDETV